MRYLGSYFPFFMLSLFLYGFVFYFYQQSTIIKSQQMNSGEPSIQLELLTTESIELITEPVAHENKAQQTEKEPTIKQEKTAVKEPVAVEKVIKNTDQKTTETVTVINSTAPSKIKVAYENSALDDATLKGELFDEPFNLNLPAPPGSYKATRYADDKIITAPVTVSSTSEKQNKKSLNPTKRNKEKTKRIFKKENSSEKEQGILQEAIVVSGNKPTYPQRAILRNQHGRVVVKLTVTMQGKAKKPQITRSSGFPILDDAVLDFIRNERFMPAHKGNEKITTEQLFSFRFELK